jgi:formate-nitrite transporter family protein
MAVEVVEWGDFECPYCQNAYPELKELRRRFGDRIAFTWRHFPLWEKHPHALLAAQAAEAARAQGRFDEMHDLLFENQRRLERDDLIGYARQLDLDVDRFTNELDEETYLARVREERAEGESIGVSGTPTLFIGGEPYQGFYDAEALSEEIAARGA